MDVITINNFLKRLTGRLIGLTFIIMALNILESEIQIEVAIILIFFLIVGLFCFATGITPDNRFNFLNNLKINIARAGEVGERQVRYALEWLPKDKYIVINSVFLEKGGIIQEYDHLVIGHKGIFSIETKNYSGKITIDTYGNWSRERNNIQQGVENPLAQVERHNKLLKNIIVDKYPIIDIVVIANKDTIVNGMENSPFHVLRHDNITNFIENYSSEFGEGKIDNIDNVNQLITLHISKNSDAKRREYKLKNYMPNKSTIAFLIVGVVIIGSQIPSIVHARFSKTIAASTSNSDVNVANQKADKNSNINKPILKTYQLKKSISVKSINGKVILKISSICFNNEEIILNTEIYNHSRYELTLFNMALKDSKGKDVEYNSIDSTRINGLLSGKSIKGKFTFDTRGSLIKPIELNGNWWVFDPEVKNTKFQAKITY